MAPPFPKPRRLRRTWPQRLLVGLNLFVITACVVAAGGLYYTFNKLGDLQRIDVSHVVTAEPDTDDGSTSPAQNFLLVGSDSRAGSNPDDPDFAGIGDADEVSGQRSDTIMILRVEPSTNQAAILSLPHDLWVNIHGTNHKGRINTAFSSGADVLIETIEENFGIPIHHYVEVDFNGFKSLVDAIGGVQVNFPAAARDGNTGLNIVAPGCATLDGEYGLAYVRSRHYEAQIDGKWKVDPASDLNRIKRQQDFVKRSLERAIDKGIRSPSVLNRLLDVATESVTLDSSLTVRDLARLGNLLRKFDPASLETFTIPNTPTKIGGADVLLPVLDSPESKALLARFTTGLALETPAPTPTQPTLPPNPEAPADVAVRVLNGSGQGGLAGTVGAALEDVGFDVVLRDNAERSDYARTLIRYEPDQLAAAQTLASYLAGGADLEETASLGSADVAVVLGHDFIKVLDAPATSPTTVAPPTSSATTVAPPVTEAPVEEANPYVPSPGGCE